MSNPKQRDVAEITDYLDKPFDVSSTPKANGSTDSHEFSGLVARNMVDFEAAPIEWLWPGVIARGAQTFVAGEPGLGKSQATLSIAATVSSGGTWPDGTRCAQGRVILLSAEDDPARTVRPRLDALGADVSRIRYIEGVRDLNRVSFDSGVNASFNMAEHLAALEIEIENYGDVSLLVVDPISAYLGGVDSHKNSDVRALLAPLERIAHKHRVAVLNVTHLNKTRGGSAIARLTGSGAFGAAARAVYLVTRDEGGDSSNRRLWLTLKNNLAPDSDGTAFTVEGATVDSPVGPISTSRVIWTGEVITTTAAEALAAGDEPGGDGSPSEEAEAFLKSVLADGSKSAKAIRRDADDAGISWRTINTVKKRLGITSRRSGNGWAWSLDNLDDFNCGEASADAS